MERKNCQFTFFEGVRRGLACEGYTGSGIFKDACFEHIDKSNDESQECIICFEIMNVFWLGSCRCKRFVCKGCLLKHVTVKNKPCCPMCNDPLRDVRMESFPSSVYLDFTYCGGDRDIHLVSSIPIEDQIEYLEGISPRKKLIKPTSTDISVINPALDALRRKRLDKVISNLVKDGKSPTHDNVLIGYEYYLRNDVYEDYNDDPEIMNESYPSFPYNISRIYWTASHRDTYVILYKTYLSEIDILFVGSKSNEQWSFQLVGIEDLIDLKRLLPHYFYNLYKVDCREAVYEANKEYILSHE